MAKRLTDEDVRSIRMSASLDGLTAAKLAKRYRVSERHVERILAGKVRAQLAGLDAKTATSSVAAAVERYLADLELDAVGEVLAATAATLAAKLDAARSSDFAASAASASALARELVQVLQALQQSRDESRPDRLDELRARRDARLLSEAHF